MSQASTPNEICQRCVPICASSAYLPYTPYYEDARSKAYVPTVTLS